MSFVERLVDFEDLISLLRCPTCWSEFFVFHDFSEAGRATTDGIVRCRSCSALYPLEDGVLELLPAGLRYEDDWERFADRWEKELREADVNSERPHEAGPAFPLPQAQGQQAHFDWYADNQVQTYSTYERSPFWRAADEVAFGPWRDELGRRAGARRARVLDVGCAQGRSTFHFADLPVDIIGFDISKRCIKRAAERARAERPHASMTFLCADATGFPFRDGCFDVVLAYGVLHHVEDPGSVCRQIARVLRPGGIYFGQENNVTVFRWVFDLLQRLRPAWYEEAGPEALISTARLRGWLEAGGMSISARTSVFLPPHLLNLLNEKRARSWLRHTDDIAQRIPGLRSNGGVVVFQAEKREPGPPTPPRRDRSQ